MTSCRECTDTCVDVIFYFECKLLSLGQQLCLLAGIAIGATLVVKVNSDTMQRVAATCGLGYANDLHMRHLISAFRTAVDNALPGYYAWFDDESLHVTVRAMMG